MAFKATDSTAQLSTALSGVMAIARGVKVKTQGLRTASAAGPISARDIVLYMDALTRANEGLDAFKATPGIVQYAKDQYNDQSYDIAAEFTAMQSAVTSTVIWIAANIPSDGQYLLIEEIVAGRLVERTLTVGQTSALRTELDALLLTIE